jgi:hypothetical protein
MTKTNNMSNDKTQSAKAEEVEVQDMDELLGTKASVAISADEESKKSVLSSSKVDTSFLDKDLNGPKDEEEDEDPEGDDSNAGNQKPKDELSNILDKGIEENDDDEDDEDHEASQRNKGGRKPALVEAMGKLVEKGAIDLFEDAPNLEDYTSDDIVELIETNLAQRINQTAQAAPMEVFKRLDPKLQDVVAYALNGGQDITNVLKTVAVTQEMTDLNVEDERDQEKIVREWLRSIDYGDENAIEDEILSLIDRGEIQKKAQQFKPKLDKKHDEILKKKLDEQEAKKERAKKASEKYAQTIYNHLNQPHLNGLQLNNKVQTMLYYGLTEKQYQDRDGNPTNALGHLIEEYQFGENANPSVLLEALWLLADPNSYRTSVANLVEKSSTSKTVRALKTAEASTTTSSNKQGTGESRGNGKRKTVKRQTGSRSIFQR